MGLIVVAGRPAEICHLFGAGRPCERIDRIPSSPCPGHQCEHCQYMNTKDSESPTPLQSRFYYTIMSICVNCDHPIDHAQGTCMHAAHVCDA